MNKEAQKITWSDLDIDRPIPLLSRQTVTGANALAAKIKLEKGCAVKMHHHESEQIAVILSGRVLWTVGHDNREIEAVGGDVLALPSSCPHGLVALEDTEVLDILSPVGPMGVDSQRTAHS